MVFVASDFRFSINAKLFMPIFRPGINGPKPITSGPDSDYESQKAAEALIQHFDPDLAL